MMKFKPGDVIYAVVETEENRIIKRQVVSWSDSIIVSTILECPWRRDMEGVTESIEFRPQWWADWMLDEASMVSNTLDRYEYDHKD
jgi:hypothetical protein